MPITLKLIFNKNGGILGAQISGQDGVDKRIDTIASVIHMKGTIYDLEELELAYARHFHLQRIRSICLDLLQKT